MLQGSQHSKLENALLFQQESLDEDWCFHEVYALQFLQYSYVSDCISSFGSFLKEFDARMSGRQVLLLIDNAPTHKWPDLELRNTKVHFLPPNTTAVLQPMDAGVIASFKRQYRSQHIKYGILVHFSGYSVL